MSFSVMITCNHSIHKSLRRLGPLLARRIATGGDDFIRAAFHDPLLVTPKILAGYRRPLRAHNWDRALWEHPLPAVRWDWPTGSTN